MSSWNNGSSAAVKNLSCLLLGVVVFAGCAHAADEATRQTGGNDNRSDAISVRTGGTEEGVEAQNATAKTIQLNGHGRQASEKFVLEPGLSVFTIHHDGDSNVVVRLLDREGKSVDTLFNQIGAFDGERGFAIAEGGQYLLDVAADGQWTIGIRQPRATEGQSIPRSLEGRGCGVTEFIHLDKGLAVFKMKHQGKGRFTVNLVDRDGHKIESLVNELGQFDGSKPINVDKPGTYFLNVAGHGNWTIDVQ
jgi:hypothetical protein